MRKPHLVEDWRNAWRWASSHAAAVLSLLAAKGLTTLGILTSVISVAPPELRSFVPIPVAVALFAGWLGLRLWKQDGAA